LKLTRRGRLAVMYQYQFDAVKAFVEGYLREQNVLRPLVFHNSLAYSNSKREGG